MHNSQNEYINNLITALQRECTWKDQSLIPRDWNIIRDLYLNALMFIRGHHPEGHVAHWEDTNFQWTPAGIISSDGICITNPSPPQDTPNDDFIWYYVSSNYWGEGTPIYIDEEIN